MVSSFSIAPGAAGSVWGVSAPPAASGTKPGAEWRGNQQLRKMWLRPSASSLSK